MKTSEELAMLTPADHVPRPRQGEWTYDAYAALPEDGKHYEIIDGVLYMTPFPYGMAPESGNQANYLFNNAR